MSKILDLATALPHIKITDLLNMSAFHHSNPVEMFAETYADVLGDGHNLLRAWKIVSDASPERRSTVISTAVVAVENKSKIEFIKYIRGEFPRLNLATAVDLYDYLSGRIPASKIRWYDF